MCNFKEKQHRVMKKMWKESAEREKFLKKRRNAKWKRGKVFHCNKILTLMKKVFSSRFRNSTEESIVEHTSQPTSHFHLFHEKFSLLMLLVLKKTFHFLDLFSGREMIDKNTKNQKSKLIPKTTLLEWHNNITKLDRCYKTLFLYELYLERI